MNKTTIISILLLICACSKNSDSPNPPVSTRAPNQSSSTNESLNLKDNSTELQDGLGFYDLSNPGVPEIVKKTDQSVFELRTLAIASDEMLKSVDVTENKGSDLRNKINDLDPKSFDAIDKKVLIKQIEKCESYTNQEMKKNCALTFDIRKSTGFLAGRANTFWTNAHVVDGAMTYIEKLAGIKKSDQLTQKQRLVIFIFDQNGNLVFDPYKDKISIKTLPPKSYVATYRKSFYAEDSDAVSLEISKNIGTPLQFSSEPIHLGQKVYVLGYPACTACDTSNFQVDDKADFLDRTPYPNSNGIGLKISSGRILSPTGLASFFGMAESSMNYWNLAQMIINSADSNHGNSGGPVINDKGLVVAVHSGGKSRVVNGQLQRISRSVFLTNFLN